MNAAGKGPRYISSVVEIVECLLEDVMYNTAPKRILRALEGQHLL